MPDSASSSGQVLLIVLLTMAVGLVVVLSVVSRTITDIGETSREDDSGRAFSAAEAGVEKALITGSGVGGALENRSSFSTTITGIASGATEYNYPAELLAGDSATVWFVSHASNGDLVCDANNPCYVPNNLLGSLNICWDSPGLPTPAVEVSVLYDTTAPAGVDSNDWSGVRILRSTYDIEERVPDNNFTSAFPLSCQIAGKSYQIRGIVDLTPTACAGKRGCLLLAKVRMLYNGNVPKPLGVFVNDSSLPGQGLKVVSTGTAGEATRKVEVYRTFGELPPVFDAALFSPATISKGTLN